MTKPVEIGSAEARTAYGTAHVAVIADAGDVVARVTVLGVTQSIHLPPDAAERLGNLLRNGAVEARQLVTAI